MTFRLPEIEVSDRVYDIAKIAVLVSIFVVFVIGVTSASDAEKFTAKILEKNGVDSYNFVYCKNPVTNITITYPEGTECDVYDETEEGEEEDDDSE
jgi:hypothetical protein